jgi:hypothetical protein
MSKSYQRAPRVSRELLPRYKAVSEVLAGVLTVSEAARRLKLSRNRFQSVMHRALEGLLAGLRVKAPGRPRRPEWEKALREEAERLRRENERLVKQAENTDRLLSLARGVLTSRTGRRQSPGPKRAKTEDE